MKLIQKFNSSRPARPASLTWTRSVTRTGPSPPPTCACACRSACRRTPPCSARRARSRKVRVAYFITLLYFIYFMYLLITLFILRVNTHGRSGTRTGAHTTPEQSHSNRTFVLSFFVSTDSTFSLMSLSFFLSTCDLTTWNYLGF